MEDSKIELTHQERRPIDLSRLEPGLSAELSRPLFEQAIDAQLQRIRAGLQELLTRAGVGAGQVDTLFFTGGSSSVPALRGSVASLLPNARLVDGDSFGGIGSGLALEAFKRYG
ncbi:putative chaperone [compost metagenome]